MLPYGATKESSMAQVTGYPVRISRFMSVRKLFGLSKSTVDAQLGAGVTSASFAPGSTQVPDANHSFYWVARVWSPYATGGAGNVYRLRVWITYYVEFFERNIPIPYSDGVWP